MLEKSSGKVGVRTVRETISILAGERQWGDTRESWLSRAADKLKNIPYRMLRSLFYGEITDEKHWAVLELREAVTKLEAQREREQAAAIYETLVSQLLVVDENFHEPQIAALLDRMRALRGQDSPGSEGELK